MRNRKSLSMVRSLFITRANIAHVMKFCKNSAPRLSEGRLLVPLGSSASAGAHRDGFSTERGRGGAHCHGLDNLRAAAREHAHGADPALAEVALVHVRPGLIADPFDTAGSRRWSKPSGFKEQE